MSERFLGPMRVSKRKRFLTSKDVMRYHARSTKIYNGKTFTDYLKEASPWVGWALAASVLFGGISQIPAVVKNGYHVAAQNSPRP